MEDGAPDWRSEINKLESRMYVLSGVALNPE